MPAPLPAILRHLRSHVGAGMLCAVGYFQDPGNWSVDVQAGTTFGYRPMLFVILISGMAAILFQVLATRLGCVTGLDLAANCRVLLHDHPKHPRIVRFLVFYPLYIISELAIIATDLAELLGSAIGITLLVPSLPLWACVLLTALDVFVFLFVTDNSRVGRPVRPIEIVIILLVAAIFTSLIVIIIKANPVWPQVFLGFVPSKELFGIYPNAIYTAISIIGATIMPHGLFLGSYFATQDRLSSDTPILPSPVAQPHTSPRFFLRSRCSSMFSITRVSHDSVDGPSLHLLRRNNSLSFIQAHLAHATVDIALSLLAIAIPINAAILTISAAVPRASMSTSVGIPTMYDLIHNTLGKGVASLFAVALVFSGQAASVIATLAGQVVSEGFILWSISPFLRRLVTRLLSLIPSMIVAMAFGRSGLNTLLVASQVALSVVLPFVMLPLIFLTSSKTVMSVNVPKADLQTDRLTDQTPTVDSDCAALSESTMEDVKMTAVGNTSNGQVRSDTTDFSSGYIASAVAYGIWLVISIANVYGIAVLGLTG